MEEAKGKHSLHLHDRETGSVSGVLDVVSFDTEIILLETTRGMLTIRGEKLHVSRLCLEKGEVIPKAPGRERKRKAAWYAGCFSSSCTGSLATSCCCL